MRSGKSLLVPVAIGLLSACSSVDPKEPKNLVKKPSLAEERILEDAMKAYDRGLYTVSIESWTDLRDGYPASYFGALAELKIADAYFYAGDYPAAITAYEEFAKMHPGHEAMPYVRFQIGRSNSEQYKGEKRDQEPLKLACKNFSAVISEFPRSEFAVLAKRELDRARDRLAEHEAFVAGFYAKQGYPKASAGRLQTLIVNYPETPANTASKSIAEQIGVEIETKAVKAPSVEPPARPNILINQSR
jgi:outer membrane protein assembly factor BamD